MLISHKHQFLFVHIAKTGGTSVRSALRRYRWSGRYGPALFIASMMSQMTRPRHRLGVKFPRHAKAVAAKEMLPAEIYDQLFKFVFVRNPWDLQVSSWHHIGREKPHVLGSVKTFEEFLRLKFDPDREYDYMLDISRELQSDYIVDLHGHTIVDFIGRYDNLQADFDRVCERIGLPLRVFHHVRNPFDNIARMALVSDVDVTRATQRYFRCVDAAMTTIEQLSGEEVMHVYHEQVIRNPRSAFVDMLEHLGLVPREDYLEACAGRVMPAARRSRDQVEWTSAQVDEVERRIAAYPHLFGYTFAE